MTGDYMNQILLTSHGVFTWDLQPKRNSHLFLWVVQGVGVRVGVGPKVQLLFISRPPEA